MHLKKREKRLTLAFALAVLILSMLGMNLLGLVAANPYYCTGEVPPDDETYPPVIAITSPKNNTAYATSRLSLIFNVSAPQSKTASSTSIQRVSYQTDWREKLVDIFVDREGQLSFSLQLSGIPEGQHSILIKAFGMGVYVNVKELSYTEFFINSVSLISFTIDRTAPIVSVLPVENMTSVASGVPLNFTVNETNSQISYALNGQENVTITGNSTLHGLSTGLYNLTVFVWDVAGNVGSSETVTFTIAGKPEPTGKLEPFPTVPVAATSVASAAVVAAVGLIFYYKKRKH